MQKSISYNQLKGRNSLRNKKKGKMNKKLGDETSFLFFKILCSPGGSLELKKTNNLIE